MESASTYSPGLEGVIAGVTGVSSIDTERNVLTYRGYDVADLCRYATFEEVAYLLLHGELPSRAQLAEFAEWLISERAVPEAVYSPLSAVPPGEQPMDWLQVLAGMLTLFDPQRGDNSPSANLGKAVRLAAKLPTLVANGWHTVNGSPRIDPMSGPRAHAAHFLYLLTGEEPGEFEGRLLNTSLILYAEHGFNASTFAARVTVSTLAGLYQGVVSAIGTLKGPLHGGANEEVMRMLLQIGEPANAEPWLRRRLLRTTANPHPRVMGFGHREYKRGDQRAQIMREWTRDLARRTGDTRWVDIEEALERVMLREKRLYPNLDFPVSPAYYMLGLPIPLYTPIFVLARVVGWSAHVAEQLADNRIIRPTSLYDGPPARAYVPMDEREQVRRAA